MNPYTNNNNNNRNNNSYPPNQNYGHQPTQPLYPNNNQNYSNPGYNSNYDYQRMRSAEPVQKNNVNAVLIVIALLLFLSLCLLIAFTIGKGKRKNDKTEEPVGESVISTMFTAPEPATPENNAVQTAPAPLDEADIPLVTGGNIPADDPAITKASGQTIIIFDDPIGEVKVNTKRDDLNIRDIPSKSGNIIIGIPKGTIVPYYQYTNGWTLVSYKGKYGWVDDHYLQYGVSSVRKTTTTRRTTKTATQTTTTSTITTTTTSIFSETLPPTTTTIYIEPTTELILTEPPTEAQQSAYGVPYSGSSINSGRVKNDMGTKFYMERSDTSALVTDVPAGERVTVYYISDDKQWALAVWKDMYSGYVKCDDIEFDNPIQ